MSAAPDLAEVRAAATLRRLHPRAYLSRLLEQGLRPDGRGPMQTRPTRVIPGAVKTSDGSALATVGRTSVVCGVRALAVQPRADAARKGQVAVTVHLTGLCADKYQGVATLKMQGPSPPLPNDAGAIVQHLNRLVESAGLLDLEQLCIEPGRAVFCLACDLVCLEDDGNVMDACVLAFVGALKDVRLPLVVVTELGELVRAAADDSFGGGGAARRGLVLGLDPVPLSFGVFEGTVLADPNADEEGVMDGSVAVLLDARTGRCSLSKPGGPPLSLLAVKAMVECCKAAAAATAAAAAAASRGEL